MAQWRLTRFHAIPSPGYIIHCKSIVDYVFDPSFMLDDSHCSGISSKSTEVSCVVLIKSKVEVSLDTISHRTRPYLYTDDHAKDVTRRYVRPFSQTIPS